VGFETVINLISATTTRTGLNLQALLDEREYETGQRISDEAMQQLYLRKHEQDPRWELHPLAPPSS
jgi:Rhodopirellula transposase DDE domain